MTESSQLREMARELAGIPWIADQEAAILATLLKAKEAGERLERERQEMLQDSAYLAGAKAGWNCAQADEPEEAYQRLAKSREGHLRPLTERRRAIRQNTGRG